ncbi:MAG: hypothetical protein OHK0015_19670 [Chloroflexi bacterium OHK40]
MNTASTPHRRQPLLARLLPALLMVCTIALGLLLPTGVAAAPRPWMVQGEFRTQIQPPESCPPPSTLCARGVATGDIKGDTEVVITSSEIVVEADGTPFSVYTGTITITSRRGTLSGTVSGRVRLTDGQLTSTVTFTSGTRFYRKVTGTLAVTGQIDLATGSEVDTYSGTLVRN